ncbi:MAG: PKD domain-containing protein, partial [Candidatus Bathyarchaeia archaeon]
MIRRFQSCLAVVFLFLLSVSIASATVGAQSVPSVSVTPGSWTMDKGQSKTFTASASGGSGTYTSYHWYVDGVAQSGQTASTFVYTPSSAGNYSITVTVTDSSGVTSAQSSAAAVIVNTNPAVSVSPPSWTMDLGQSKTFTVNTGGGVPPYSYTWFVDYVAQSETSGSFVFTPNTIGSHTISVTLTDNVGGQVGSYSNIAVSSTLVAPSISASSSTINQSQT